MESGNEEKVGDFKPEVGTKVTWTEKGETVNAYVVEVREKHLVLKVHGRKGKFIVDKNQKVKNT